MELKRTKSQTLKLIFQLAPISETSMELRVGNSLLSTQERSSAIPDAATMAIVVKTMQSLDIPIEFFDRGTRISVSSLLRRIEKKGGLRHSIETGGLYFDLGVAASREHCFILIREIIPGASIDWDRWVGSFIQHSGFVQAFAVDTEYDHWQNVKDPLQYGAAQRDFSNLPLRCNELPPPLHRMEIDTTRNPGRWSLEAGYIEAVAATMWFGEAFWERVGEDRRQQLFEAGFMLSYIGYGVYKLAACDAPFDDDRTSVIQDRLRSIIYRR